jgi:hypothetical protein
MWLSRMFQESVPISMSLIAATQAIPVVGVRAEEQFGVRVLERHQAHQEPVLGHPWVGFAQIGVQTRHHTCQIDLVEVSVDFPLRILVGFKDWDALIAGAIREKW